MITVANSIYETYPGACFGILSVRGFEAKNVSDFTAVKEAEVQAIRNRYPNYERKDFVQTDPVCHYVRYYKSFKKTYHVLHQLESILLKDKTIPDTDPLAQALFLAEVKHMLLIAGHDLDAAVEPLTMKLSRGGERYAGKSGQEIELKEDDIYLRDEKGIMVTIIYGQDDRTRITQNTRNVIYVIDGVDGITDDRLTACLEDILRYVRVFDPAVEPTYMGILRANKA